MTLAAADRRDAFEVLVGRYLSRLTRYCAKFLGSPSAGEEIAQEILVDTWWQRARYRAAGRFPVFLFTLARNRCLNRVRDERRRPRWTDDSSREGDDDAGGSSAPDSKLTARRTAADSVDAAARAQVGKMSLYRR